MNIISVLWMWNVTCNFLYMKVTGHLDETSISPKNLKHVSILMTGLIEYCRNPFLTDGLKNVYIPLEHILLIWRQKYYRRRTLNLGLCSVHIICSNGRFFIVTQSRRLFWKMGVRVPYSTDTLFSEQFSTKIWTVNLQILVNELKSLSNFPN